MAFYFQKAQLALSNNPLRSFSGTNKHVFTSRPLYPDVAHPRFLRRSLQHQCSTVRFESPSLPRFPWLAGRPRPLHPDFDADSTSIFRSGGPEARFHPLWRPRTRELLSNMYVHLRVFPCPELTYSIHRYLSSRRRLTAPSSRSGPTSAMLGGSDQRAGEGHRL